MKPKTVGRDYGQSPVQAQHLITGVMPGSIILTLDGEMPVEHLVPGDRVITRNTGMAVLRDIRRTQITTRAVRIMAGSLGDTRPDRDVIIPHNQPVLVRDWRAKALFGLQQTTVWAGALIDDEFIEDMGEITMDILSLYFDAPHVLYIDGLELAGQVIDEAQANAA